MKLPTIAVVGGNKEQREGDGHRCCVVRVGGDCGLDDAGLLEVAAGVAAERIFGVEQRTGRTFDLAPALTFGLAPTLSHSNAATVLH